MKNEKLHWAIRLRKMLLINGTWECNAWIRDFTAMLERKVKNDKITELQKEIEEHKKALDLREEVFRKYLDKNDELQKEIEKLKSICGNVSELLTGGKADAITAYHILDNANLTKKK